jgi:hypothetical protein
MPDHWERVKETFGVLGYLVKICAPERTGMQATIGAPDAMTKGKDRAQFKKLFQNVAWAKPQRPCNMSYCIRRVLSKWWADHRTSLERDLAESSSIRSRVSSTRHKVKGLDLYIFTAGAWKETPGFSKCCEVDKVIKELFDDMIKHDVDPRDINIRFISFSRMSGSVEAQRFLDLETELTGLGIPR